MSLRSPWWVSATLFALPVIGTPLFMKGFPTQEPFDNDDDETTSRDILQYPYMRYLDPAKLPWWYKGKDGSLEIRIRASSVVFHFLRRLVVPQWLEKAWFHLTRQTMPYTVDILDARARQDKLTFETAGFTLLKLDPDTLPKLNENTFYAGQMEPFKAKLIDAFVPKLKELFPEATRFEWSTPVIRRLGTFLDQMPIVDGPHMDFHPDDAMRQAFHQEYPPAENAVEQRSLLGELDTETDEFRVMLGLWKPLFLQGGPVYDLPLAVCDASTVQVQDLYPSHFHFLNIASNLGAALLRREKHQWYYYPKQTEDELLVFTQYTKGQFWSTPHTSILCLKRPKDGTYRPRSSVEIRVSVFFPKET